MGTQATWWWRVGTIAATFQPPRDGTPTPADGSVSGDGPGGGDVSGRRPLVAVYFTGQARTLNRPRAASAVAYSNPSSSLDTPPSCSSPASATMRLPITSDTSARFGTSSSATSPSSPALTSRAIQPKSPYRGPSPTPESDPQPRRRGSRARVCASSGARVDGSTAAATAPSAALKTPLTARRYCRSCTTARWWTGFGDDGRRGVPQRSSGSSAPRRIRTSTIRPMRGFDPEAERGTVWAPPGARATTRTRARAS